MLFYFHPAHPAVGALDHAIHQSQAQRPALGFWRFKKKALPISPKIWYHTILHVMKKIAIALFVASLLFPFPVFATATFNPGNIISDFDMVNNASMSVSHIQRFLEGKTGTLATYKITDPWGNVKTAAQVIYDAGNYYRINPQVLIVVLQKEQSLVTDSTPTQSQYDWAAGYGVCDSCSKDDPAIQQYKGFFNQVNWAAKRNRQYIDQAGQWYFKVGGTYVIDDVTVTIQNQATVNLYTYTPHIHGNEVFWTLWNSWFLKNYPDGSLLQVQGEQGVYLIQNGKRRPFLSRTALVTRYDTSRIIQVSRSDIDAYDEGQPIKFANYSLVRSNTTGRVFLIDGDTKRYIESPEVFRQIGFNPEEIIVASDGELAVYSNGPNINMQSIYPTGVLLQSLETGGISYVENGVRQSIWSREILRSRFPNRKPVVVEQTTINQYKLGDPIKFKDGEIVTSPSMRGVYVISNGQRRGIASIQAFNALGYKWDNLIRTTDAALFLHPEGDPIDIVQ